MKIIYRRKLYFVILLVLSLFVAATSVAPTAVQAQTPPLQTTDAFESAECWFDDPLSILPGHDFECGYVTVPERHANPNGPTIRLPIAILRTSSENPQPDPLFLAQGGPGGDAFEIFPILAPSSATAVDRDLVIINQRGTNYAEPNLACTELFEIALQTMSMSVEEGEALQIEALKACYQRLSSEGVDLSAFNSLENAADIESIRAALGYESYNFYGVSYGTLLGLHLMNNQSENLRSVVLDGVVPPNLNFIPEVTANTDRVFTEIMQTCADDATCNATYPDLESRFFAIVDNLNAEPVSLTLKNGETGERVKAALDGDTLVDVLFQAFYLPDAYALFPKLVTNLEAGDYTFIQEIWPLFAFDTTSSDGMYFSVICAEDSDFVPEDVNLEGIRPYFAEGALADLQSYIDICEFWQVEQLPASVDDAVVSNIPTLLISGQYDPITPPSFAEVAVASLGNGYHIVQPTGSHGNAFQDPCVDNIMTQFLNVPGQEPNTSCLSGITPAEFVPSNALSFPFLGAVNQLSTTLWVQLGLASLFLLGVLSAFVVLPIVWLIGILQRGSKNGDVEEGSVEAETAVVPPKQSRRLKWIGGLTAMLFGFLAIIFVTGASFFTFQSLFNGMASIFSISGAATPFFIIPWLLFLIAVGLATIVIIAWRKGNWSIWLRLYYGFLAVCAIGYVAVIAYGGMLTVLL